MKRRPDPLSCLILLVLWAAFSLGLVLFVWELVMR